MKTPLVLTLAVVTLSATAAETWQACQSVFDRARVYTDLLTTDQREYYFASEACSYRSSTRAASGSARLTELASDLGISGSSSSEVIRQACEKKLQIERTNQFLSLSTSALLSDTLPLYQACLDASNREMRVRLVVDDLFPKLVQISLSKPEAPGVTQEVVSGIVAPQFNCHVNPREQDGRRQPQMPATDVHKNPLKIIGRNTAEIVCTRSQIDSLDVPSVLVSVDGNPLIFTFPKRDPRILKHCTEISAASKKQGEMQSAYSATISSVTAEIAKLPDGKVTGNRRLGRKWTRDEVNSAVGTKITEQTLRMVALDASCAPTLEAGKLAK